MQHKCKLCNKEFKSLSGLKCHVKVKHGLSYEAYKTQLKKARSNKGVSKISDRGNNSNNSASSISPNSKQSAGASQQVLNEEKVIDLKTYKDGKAPDSGAQVITDIEAERWGRLTAEQKNTLQAIKLYEGEMALARHEYEKVVTQRRTEILHLRNVLQNTIKPEYESLMQTLSEKYKIPRNQIAIHMDTHVIWDLSESKEVPQVAKEVPQV